MEIIKYLLENIVFPLLIAIVTIHIEKYINNNFKKVMFFNGSSYSSHPYEKIRDCVKFCVYKPPD